MSVSISAKYTEIFFWAGWEIPEALKTFNETKILKKIKARS